MDYYAEVAEMNADYDYSDEPLQAVVDRQRDVIGLMAKTITSLQKDNRQLRLSIEALEKEHRQRDIGYVYGWNANVRADGAYQT